MIKGATLFGGGEAIGIAMRQAGIQHIWGVEKDAATAEVAHLNGFNSIVADICDIDPADYENVDIVHASPVCKRYSVQNQKGEESTIDIETARATCRFIKAKLPRVFTLENVIQYGSSRALRLITKCLSDNGYNWETHKVNSADYGVPQARRRLILIARRDNGDCSLPTPTHMRGGSLFHKPHIGWYAALKDITTTFPNKNLVDWQIKRLPDNLVRVAQELPDNADPFLVSGAHSKSNGKKHFLYNFPSPTISTESPHFRCVLPHEKRVARISVRGLARLQSFPDSYLFPCRETTDEVIQLASTYPEHLRRFVIEHQTIYTRQSCIVIGNAVPPTLMTAVYQHICANWRRYDN